METRITDEAHAMEALSKDFLAKSGWLESYMTRRSISANEGPLAWWSYPALTFLDERIKKDMTVFEYGCGYSTMWMAARTKYIRSVETDEPWFERMIPKLPENAVLTHSEPDNFAESIKQYQEQFDIIVIDGHDRNACAVSCLSRLKPDGVIIFDNFGTRWRPGFNYLESQGFRRIIFQGLAPICTYEVRTTIVYRPNNCFKI